MKTKIILLCIFLLATHYSLLAQTVTNEFPPKSIHQLEWEAHRNMPKQPSFFDPSGKGIRPLNRLAKVTTPQKAVFGYLPDWEYTTARKYLQYDLLTHIAAFDFAVDANGNIAKPSYWPWTDIINKAHANGVKVIMTVVNFNANDIHTILTEANVKSRFFTNVKTLLNQYSLDGVNVDFEGLSSADRGSLLNGFMDDLSQSVKQTFPHAEVSFAGPAVNWGGWDLLGLSQACDYIFIMGYAFSGGWSAYAGPTAPLTGGNYNITNTVTVQYAEVLNSHPEKLILGLPYYGCRWKTTSSLKGAATSDFLGNPFYSQEEKEAENYGSFWDTKSQTPWYRYQIGSQWYQVWYDDARSLGLKYNFADEHSLKGVGMWALGYDNGRSELWNLLRRHYLPQSTPWPEAPKAIFVRSGNNGNSLFMRFDSVYGVDGYAVYLSTDGNNFNLTGETARTSVTIDSLEPNRLYYVMIKSFNERGYSDFSSLLTATTSAEHPALLVDGFERNDTGENTFRYLKYHASSFNANNFPVASATNEALIQGICPADSFKMIDWMLGNEGSNDFTFNGQEQNIVRRFLKNGGRLLVSGSEVGWDLVAKGSPQDRDFFSSYLKASYVADAPLGQSGRYYQMQPIAGTIFDGLSSISFDNGSHGTYNVKWPDAILPVGGATLGLQFTGVSTTNGGGGIYYSGTFGDSGKEGKLVLLTVPLETVYVTSVRNALVGKIMDFLMTPTGFEPERNSLPVVFKVWPNYPNPFNGHTRFAFEIRQRMDVSLHIYSIRGREVYRKTLTDVQPGRHSFIWEGIGKDGRSLASGSYIYRLLAKDKNKSWRASGKMILLK